MSRLYTPETVYAVGLALVMVYLLVGIDDFIWDIYAVVMRFRGRRDVLDLPRLDSIPPKLLALAIAAWHEDNVLSDVVENIINSTHYPASMYHVFLGVYPNDAPTVKAARELEKRFPNVHAVLNPRPGPTSKAQNINNIIKEIKRFERKKGWRFAGLTVHDSEDVVHPLELKVTNYLLNKHDALQFPVFPLIKLPRLGNFLSTLTTCTYADEFAENHFMTMVGRYRSGAFVPSAGTGFALSRRTIDSFGDGDVLPDNYLTEDYRMALSLYARGIRMYYVLERIPRIRENGRLYWDYIATRSRFPDTLSTAVRQKTRWILGITMQSFTFKDIFRMRGLRFAGRYSLYKDIKAKVSNLMAFMGYPVLVYVVASMFTPLIQMFPRHSLSWYISIIVSCMMAERQLSRGVSVYRVYGFRSMFYAVLMPPLLPLRMVWGNVINLLSTLRAYRQKYFGGPKEKKPPREKKKEKTSADAEKKIAWDKTRHAFLDKTVLLRYHRRLGDVLMERGSITPEKLQKALEAANVAGIPLGRQLQEDGSITEAQMLSALSAVKHTQYFYIQDLSLYGLSDFAGQFDGELLRELLAAPLLKTGGGYVVAFCDGSPPDAADRLRESCGKDIREIFACRETVEEAIDAVYAKDSGVRLYSTVRRLCALNAIDGEQAIIAYNHSHSSGLPEEAVLRKMGLLGERAVIGSALLKEARTA